MAANAVNDQIADAVAQVNQTVGGTSESQARAMAGQVMAHAIALAMQMPLPSSNRPTSRQRDASLLRGGQAASATRAEGGGLRSAIGRS